MRQINYEILIASPDMSEQNLGGTVRDIGMLDLLSEEIDEISNPIKKAATALQKIATRHPFIQGNKRTAVAVACIILDIAGYELTVSDEKLNADIRKIIILDCSVDLVFDWIVRNLKNR